MKMYEAIELAGFYERIKNCKMPLKTSYKFSKLMRQLEKELAFYQEEFSKIVQTYAQIENGRVVYSEDRSSIIIIPGKEQECNNKIYELKNLDIKIDNIEFDFSEIEALEELQLTVSEMACLLPLIKD